MRRIVILIAGFVFLGATNGFAGPLKERAWEFGADVSYIHYDEPGVMEEKGMMYGVVGSYTYRNGWMLRGEGRFSYGQVDYEGSGTLNNVDDYLLEFRVLGGYDFPAFEATVLTPYIGFGYRYLNDDLRGVTSTGARGYERESNYFYTPIGLETMTTLERGWSFGTMIEFDYFWKGIQKSHLSDTGLGLNDIENDQNEGYGVRGSLKFRKEGERFDFALEPFITYWDIKESEETPITYAGTIIGYGYEPKNTSTEVGLRATVNF